MKVGVPREIKDQENRVALTPSGARALVRRGHTVFVERGAGEGSGLLDSEYEQAGAQLTDRDEVFGSADMVVKVKEPLPAEYPLLQNGQTLFTYLHLAASKSLTEVLLKRGVVGVAYETIQDRQGNLPLLAPMSRIAGRMATQIGAHFLERYQGGAGILLGGIPGVAPAHVVVIGAGTVGANAIAVAVGMGAQVTVLDVSVPKLEALEDRYVGRVTTMLSTEENISGAVQTADLLIGAALTVGARAPLLVTEAMVRTMRKGSVIVDVAIDQGGIVETCDHVTSHAEPTYVRHGVVHYTVPNMPGAVPRTSTFALTNVTLPFIRSVADDGLKALSQNPMLSSGVNVFLGSLTNQSVADALDMPCVSPKQALVEYESA